MQLTESARARPMVMPLPPLAAIVMAPDVLVTVIPVPAVKVVRVNPVPLPMSRAPFAGVVVRPVPPLATATVPVTLAAVPVVFWFSVGTSAATIAANSVLVPSERR